MRNKRSNKILVILLIAWLLLPNFVLAQVPTEAPKTLEEAQRLEEKALETTQKELPGIIERIWREEVLPVWQSIWNWVKNWWRNTIWPWISGFWKEEVRPPIEEETEKRKSIIEEEFKKEKEEIKKEAPKATKSFWERFKELIK